MIIQACLSQIGKCLKLVELFRNWRVWRILVKGLINTNLVNGTSIALLKECTSMSHYLRAKHCQLLKVTYTIKPQNIDLGKSVHYGCSYYLTGNYFEGIGANWSPTHKRTPLVIIGNAIFVFRHFDWRDYLPKKKPKYDFEYDSDELPF